jgi:hypothetical protein
MKRAPLAGGPTNPLQEDDLPAIAGGVPVRSPQSRLIFAAAENIGVGISRGMRY